MENMFGHLTCVRSHAGSDYRWGRTSGIRIFDQLSRVKRMGQPVSHMHAHTTYLGSTYFEQHFWKIPGVIWFNCGMSDMITCMGVCELISRLGPSTRPLMPFIFCCAPLSAGVNTNLPVALEGHYDDVASGALWQKYACMHHEVFRLILLILNFHDMPQANLQVETKWTSHYLDAV